MLKQDHSSLLLQVQNLLLFLSSFVLFLLSSFVSPSTSRPLFHYHPPPAFHLISPPDAAALLSFKSKADLSNHLLFSPNSSAYAFCKWQGVQCNAKQKVERLVLQGLDLGGIFAPNTLSLLDELRVLSLQNNSLVGPIPDLSNLHNLKSLFLDNNHFTGSFPPSILTLHRLRTLDLSHNNLSGPIPTNLTKLDRFYYLRLTSNQFNGSIPPFNQSSLRTFDLSNNNFSGPIPVTLALIHFGPSPFSQNPSLCGEIIRKECHPSAPFFAPAAPEPPPPAAVEIGQSAEVHGVDGLIRPPYKKKHSRNAIILGFSAGVCVVIASIICVVVALRKHGEKKESSRNLMDSDTAEAAAAMQTEQEKEMEEKVKKVQQEMQVGKSGSLMFCAGEAQLYTLDQLMRASAELLGRGSLGTTYKAVLDNRLIVTVKRLDATKMATDSSSKEMFDSHMESVGGLRHPNLVPLRAYFQAREERLLIYDYEPNGSLFSLIHGKILLSSFQTCLL